MANFSPSPKTAKIRKNGKRLQIFIFVIENFMIKLSLKESKGRTNYPKSVKWSIFLEINVSGVEIYCLDLIKGPLLVLQGTRT